MEPLSRDPNIDPAAYMNFQEAQPLNDSFSYSTSSAKWRSCFNCGTHETCIWRRGTLTPGVTVRYLPNTPLS